MKTKTYAWWREAVKTEMILRGVITSSGAQAEREAERVLRESETGPLACVPSPEELWEGGETPKSFVKHEYLSHLRTEKTEAEFLLSQLKRLVGSTIVSAEIKDGVLCALVERATKSRLLKRDAHVIRFSTVPGHVEIKREP